MTNGYDERIFSLIPVLKQYGIGFFDKDKKECVSILTSNGMNEPDAEMYGTIIETMNEYIRVFVGESKPENVITFALGTAQETRFGINEVLPLMHELNQAWWVTNYVVPYGSDKDGYREMWFYNELEGIIDYYDGFGLSASEIWVDGLRYHAVPRYVYCHEQFNPVSTSFLMSISSENATLLLPDTLETISVTNRNPKYRPKNLKTIWVDPDNENLMCKNGNLYWKKNDLYNPTGEEKLCLSTDLRDYRGPIYK